MPIVIAQISAIAGVVLAAVLIVSAHRRRPELPAFEIALSVYFTDRTRAIMTLAYAAIAVALLSTAFVLAMDGHPAALIAASACCVGATLLAPVVATTARSAAVARSEATRRVHRYAAAAAFAAVGTAMAVSAYAAIVEADALVAMLGCVGALLVIRVFLSRPGPGYGLRQKCVLVILGSWIVAIAIVR